MKPLNELINKEEPGIELILQWQKEATNSVLILPTSRESGEIALLELQITTRSPMGAIAYETGGILVNDGWIRILGAGNKLFKRSLPAWNTNKATPDAPFLLVADDVIGGFFAINAGALGKDLGMLYYFAPDTLEWEPMEMGYSDFIWWTFTGNLDLFYEGYQWENWKEEVIKMGADSTMNFYPFLWMEYEDINQLSRKPVPVEETWALQLDILEQMNQKK